MLYVAAFLVRRSRVLGAVEAGLQPRLERDMMALLRRLFGRLFAFVTPRLAEQDLAREVAAHLALLEDDFVARGMSRPEAAVAARRALGGVDQTKERHRDARSFMWLEDLRRDVPYALRGLRRAPGFTAAAVVTLALGIGATTSVFSVVNAVLLQPLPYKNSDRLVRIAENVTVAGPEGARPMRRFGMTYDEFQEWRQRTRTLSSMESSSGILAATLISSNGPVRVNGARVSPGLFPMLGAQARLGRLFYESDVALDADALVLSTTAWERYFASDPNVIGRIAELNTRAYQIVGVMQDGFNYPSGDLAVWTLNPRPDQGTSPFGANIARLADGVAIDAATAEANSIGPEVRRQGLTFGYGSGPPPPPASSSTSGTGQPSVASDGRNQRFQAIQMKDLVVEPVRPALRVLTFSVAVVLLLVCANIANLLLARGTARQREVGIRLAIGAARGRIVRQVLTESAVLSVAGGIAGIAVAVAGVHAIKALSSVSTPLVFQMSLNLTDGSILPRLDEIGVDWIVLAFALGISVLVGLMFGLTPAVYLSRVSYARAIGAGSTTRSSVAGTSRARLGYGLVVAQIVMATTLLVGSGLLVHSFVKLVTVDTGYDPRNVLTFQTVFPRGSSVAQRWSIVEGLLSRLQALPQVESAGFTNIAPFLALTEYGGLFLPPDKPAEEMLKDPLRPQLRSVSVGFLPTIGARLLDGRWLSDQDGPGQPQVMMVNRALVQRYFGGTSPVGTFVRMQRSPQVTETWQIVGVIDDVRQARLDEAPFPLVYLDVRQTLARDKFGPSTNYLFGFPTIAVRTIGDPAAVVADARTVLRQLDPATSLDSVALLDDLKSGSLVRPRFYTVLLSIFAGIAGLLAAVGVYAVLAYTVVQRTQEIGVRMALGAQRAQVLRMVLRRGIVLTTIGIVLGVAGAAGLTRYLSGMLYGLTPLDPTTYVAVAVGFALVALLASYLPARRATKVDPMVALRCE